MQIWQVEHTVCSAFVSLVLLNFQLKHVDHVETLEGWKMDLANLAYLEYVGIWYHIATQDFVDSLSLDQQVAGHKAWARISTMVKPGFCDAQTD
jgi:hypothetical protein